MRMPEDTLLAVAARRFEDYSIERGEMPKDELHGRDYGGATRGFDAASIVMK